MDGDGYRGKDTRPHTKAIFNFAELNFFSVTGVLHHIAKILV